MIVLTWCIAALATAGVVIRPLRWPEWIWAVGGAGLLVLLGLMPPGAALTAIGKGGDVYLFLVGMMLLSETAREHGVFDWIAAAAARRSGGSSRKLFLLVYATGVVVTTFMSNDATAVVLTPAVFAAARAAGAEPLPMLLACALIANAASFVLPISNPANLVLYGGHMPPLGQWMRSFALPSLASIAATLAVLLLLERRSLRHQGAQHGERHGGQGGGQQAERTPLGDAGRLALAGIGLTATLLVTASALDWSLGLPTALAGLVTALGVSALARRAPWQLARQVSWGVLPLVAGLFVLVEALDRTGVIRMLAGALGQASQQPDRAMLGAGGLLAVVCNLVNNLPAGLVAAKAVTQAHPPQLVTDALLIGVDLGPNLSVTGSLATILWLQAIRREGEDVSFWRFLRIGLVAMPAALACALLTRVLMT